MPKPPIPDVFQGLPVLVSESMRELDRQATERFGLSVLELMERAGQAVARETLAFLKGKPDLSIVVCCGRGANGGDGLVAARALRGAGAKAAVFLAPPKRGGEGPGSERYPEPVAANIERARQAGVAVTVADEAGLAALPAALAGADAVLDALLGTGSSGKPAGAVRDMIQAITRSKRPVLSVDIPSGLNPDTGHHSGVYVSAAATFTLGLPKRGLLAAHAKQYVGHLQVLDIGYPAELVRAFAAR